MAGDCPRRRPARGGASLPILALAIVLLAALPSAAVADRSGNATVDQDSACSAAHIRKAYPTKAERCEYVKVSCPSDGILDYYKIYYCSVLREGWDVLDFHAREVAYFVALGLGLLVLFRVLGTTADDYFAPTLTELCREMGLPPRFAGVTFLALASGAPDVSSTFAAIRGGNYDLSLGALGGAAMFVTCIVSGSVMLVGNGAKAKGALCRDIAMLVITAVSVLVIFLGGKIYKSQAIAFVVMYFTFAAIVLAADIFHRRKVIFPAMAQGGMMMMRTLSTIRRGSAAQADSLTIVDDMSSVLMDPSLPQGRSRGGGHGLEPAPTFGSTPMRRVSETEMIAQESLSESESESETSSSSSLEEEGSDSAWQRQNKLYKKQMFRAMDWDGEGDETNHGGDRGDSIAMEDVYDTYLPLTDDRASSLDNPVPSTALIKPKEFFFQFYHKAHESIHAIVYKMKTDGPKFWKEEPLLNKAMIVLEVPFTVARTLSIPAVDGEMYFKPFFVASCVGAPIWVLYNVTGDPSEAWHPSVMKVAATVATSISLGILSLIYAPLKSPPLIKLGTGFPFGLAVICLISFILAAMWINLIATELVSVVTFVGSITAIDESILGLTVIAWGNSIGDFSSNLAMAKRGLGNVSMTASFAGPVFNILVGLGFGFIFYFGVSTQTSTVVHLSSINVLAFFCIILNALGMVVSALSNRFHIPRAFGFASIGVYCVYMVSAIVMVSTNTTLPFMDMK